MIIDPHTTATCPDGEIIPLEQAVSEIVERRRFSIGLPSGSGFGERRFPVTPEGAAQLTERHIRVCMESGAGNPINYADSAYVRSGVEITSRSDVFRADVVISTAPLLPCEAKLMRRGAMLLTLLKSVNSNLNYARSLMEAGVNVIAADLIAHNGHRLVADILHEIDGCASLAIASSLLTDPVHGKGILLGGVTGIVPCEVTVIGSGMGAIAAAHNALGLGAMVHMFDNDLYSLRSASRVLNHRVITSALHPHVLHGALRGSDIVVVTPTASPVRIDADMADDMKKRVMVFDLTATPGLTFPSIPVINLADKTDKALEASRERACYTNVGCRVPRTAAMALSNALVANIETVNAALGSVGNMPQALRPALLFLWGKCVNSTLAEALGIRAINLNLLTGN